MSFCQMCRVAVSEKSFFRAVKFDSAVLAKQLRKNLRTDRISLLS